MGRSLLTIQTPVFSQSLLLVFLAMLLSASNSRGQAPDQTTGNGASGAIPQGNNSFQPETPVMTFVDPRSGQMYGRYVLYETVPVAKYEYKPVVERQYVPEWVQETKTTTQVEYVPVVTYQLQPVQVPTLNPFAAPRQYWQYVPLVQYQPRYHQTNQPITYQKYVEKEVTKYIPEMVVKQERVPKYADRPLAPTTALTATAPTAPNTPGAAQQQPPIRPLQANNQPYGSWVANAPAPYYAPQQQSPAPTNVPYNATASNNGFYGNRWGTESYALPQGSTSGNQFVNNSNPNAGLAPGWNQPVNRTASNPFGGLFNRTGPLYQAGPIQNYNQAYAAAQPAAGQLTAFGSGLTPSTSGASYVASNPSAWSSPTNGGSMFRPISPVSIPLFGNPASSNGLTFRPQTPNYTQNNANWGLSPVDNYRDPTQSGMSNSMVR